MQCKVSGVGVNDGVNREKHEFKINAEDAEITSVDVFNVYGTRCKVHFRKDDGVGYYDAVEPGQYTIAVNFSKTITLRKAACKASGSGVEGGDARKDAEFFIDTGLSYGGSGKALQIEVRDPFGEAIPVGELVDAGDGSYTGGEFHPSVKGMYEVSIKAWGDHISGSPFKPFFEAASRERSFASGPGVEGGAKARKGVTLPFTIHSRDSTGEPLSEGGEPFKVVVKGPSGVEPCELQDNEDGTYTAEFTPEYSGPYQVEISLHGKLLAVCPYKLSVLEEIKMKKAPKEKEKPKSTAASVPIRTLNKEKSVESRSRSPSREPSPPRKKSRARSRSSTPESARKPARSPERSRSSSRDSRRSRSRRARSPSQPTTGGTSELWVGGLNHDFVEADVRQLFEPYGKVVSVDLRKGWCFLKFAAREEAQAAIRRLDGTTVRDRRMSVKFRMERGAPRFEPDGGRRFGPTPLRNRSPPNRRRDDSDHDSERNVDVDRHRREGAKPRGNQERHMVDGRPKNWRVELEGLASSTGWQELKDWARDCGVNPEFTMAFGDGNGVVDFAHYSEFDTALSQLERKACDGKSVRVFPASLQPERTRSRSGSSAGGRGRKYSRSPARGGGGGGGGEPFERRLAFPRRGGGRGEPYGTRGGRGRGGGYGGGRGGGGDYHRPAVDDVRGFNAPPPSTYICHTCNKPGHWRRDCPDNPRRSGPPHQPSSAGGGARRRESHSSASSSRGGSKHSRSRKRKSRSPQEGHSSASRTPSPQQPSNNTRGGVKEQNQPPQGEPGEGDVIEIIEEGPAP